MTSKRSEMVQAGPVTNLISTKQGRFLFFIGIQTHLPEGVLKKSLAATTTPPKGGRSTRIYSGQFWLQSGHSGPGGRDTENPQAAAHLLSPQGPQTTLP